MLRMLKNGKSPFKAIPEIVGNSVQTSKTTWQLLVVKLKSSTQTSVFKTKHSNTNALKLSYITFILNMLKNDAKEMLKVLIFFN